MINQASRKEQPFQQNKSTWPRIRKYATEPLEANTFIEVLLLILTFATGIQDAISFPDFLCFASNQTGNTVVLAVGLTGFRGEFFHLANVGSSLATFLAGAIITGQLGNYIGPRQRLWQVSSHILQTIMVFGAAWLQFTHGSQQSGAWAVGAISLLAFASGAQVAVARAFQMTEISTAMATAAWVDLVIDPLLVAKSNRPRNRRAGFLVVLAAGSFAGARMRSSIGSPLALSVSAIVKGLVVLILLIAPGEKKEMLEKDRGLNV